MAGGTERRLLALAGLLHDVGKGAQRAGEPLGTFAEFGKDEVGAHGAHARWSAQFASRYVPEPWRQYLYAVLYHHNPCDRPSRIVALADRLSAMEREESEGEQRRQLLSLFSSLAQGGDELYLPLRRLAISEESLFPGKALPAPEVAHAYRQLWKDFLASVPALPQDDLDTYLLGLQLAQQRYFWCIPSAYYRSQPDVSLYDHNRSTAALAACLADIADDLLLDLLANKPGAARQQPLLSLVSGDISGVQRFLYTITASGAAKSLRGRSFYLQLLTEAAARYVLRALDLPGVNLIYAGGGHFYLLASLFGADQLSEIAAHVSRALLAQHGPALYLALGKVDLSAEDFQPQSFSRAWGRVGQEVGLAKRHRYAELQSDELARTVFAPQGAGGGAAGECSVCHAEAPEGELVADLDNPELRRCPLCASLESLASKLADATHLILFDVQLAPPARGDWRRTLLALGTDIALAQGESVILSPVARAARGQVLNLLPCEEAADPRTLGQAFSCPLAFGDRPLVNVTPRITSSDLRSMPAAPAQNLPAVGAVKELGLIQAQSQGIARLAALRMDVDDLGMLFGAGFGTGTQARATLSRVAGLSAALQRFFEGWVGELCRRANAQAGSDLTYAIYSGGDDLFIVGAWHLMPELANSIRQDLSRYACANPSVHVSAGITLHGGKFPLAQMALASGEALASGAKQYERHNGHDKDAWQFLGQVHGWEEYAAIQSLHRELVELSQLVGRGLLQVLQHLYASSHPGGAAPGRRNRLGQEQPHWGPWAWHAAYYLARLAERHKAEAPRLLALRERFGEDGYRGMERLALAARWAELELRADRRDQQKGGNEL